MKRKTVFFLIIGSVLLLVVILGYCSLRKVSNRELAARRGKPMPVLPFRFLSPLHSLEGKPVVINYFSPDCDHCQYMATQMVKNKNAFKTCEVVMVTGANEGQTRAFITQYKLNELSFITVGIDTASRFFSLFGMADSPSFFVYSRQHYLQRAIAGETRIDSLSCLLN
ncbi:TlpA family protein disulfide reductase [Mucilaginibacter celer]|uniref:TlpA family protein disulfide reductase n=1 Tax=Mucilaginibacter celer TaxID=2305508 RepID=A0A494VVW5_9SPHI|nr:TlpA disulfide reductase family protein [Mucilaginibacter celer]AYL97620.1 TlpA family protein disulfide reductase [Mucilaginibacter celer]